MGVAQKTTTSKENYPSNDDAKIDGGRRHALLGKGMIGKQQSDISCLERYCTKVLLVRLTKVRR
jgi:hypothetical protein